jgi:hypothetical protein
MAPGFVCRVGAAEIDDQLIDTSQTGGIRHY